MKTYSLSSEDLKSIGRGLLKALIGAGLTYLTQVIGHVNFGVYTPVAVAGWSMAANTAWKILDGVKE